MSSPQTNVPRSPTFVAIDFETADRGRDSACSLAIVRVESNIVVNRVNVLIRPPRRAFEFTYIHGISWRDVADSPTFAELWPTLLPHFDNVDFIAAHNASFDRSVLRTCCEYAAMPQPAKPYHCTVKLARTTWDIRPTTLPDVCRRLNIPLRHHDAASDAEACAQIMIAALQAGASLDVPKRSRVRPATAANQR